MVVNPPKYMNIDSKIKYSPSKTMAKTSYTTAR
jgi:hypothetical protein